MSNIFKKRETVGGAAATPGYALTYAHDRKMRGASEACRAAGIMFIPIVFESLAGGCPPKDRGGGVEAGKRHGQPFWAGGRRGKPP